MTPKEFWEESLDLSEAYIKAEYKKRENDDAMCWLQGAYIYQALSVVIGNAFCKGHNKYPDKPNGIKPISKEDEEIRLRNKGIKYLQEISKRNKNRGK